MKCCNSTFNAQSSRIIIIFVYVKTMKMYVIVVEALRKNEKIGFLSPPIPSFSGIYKCIIFLLNINMKCWNSTFNAQGSKMIIVVI